MIIFLHATSSFALCKSTSNYCIFYSFSSKFNWRSSFSYAKVSLSNCISLTLFSILLTFYSSSSIIFSIFSSISVISFVCLCSLSVASFSSRSFSFWFSSILLLNVTYIDWANVSFSSILYSASLSISDCSYAEASLSARRCFTSSYSL